MGGFRMRKSIKVAPGVRLNVSKRGVGMSAGVGGVRYSVHSSGRRTTTVRSGVPGVYYQSSRGGGRRRSTAASRSASYAPPAPRPVKPGLFAPKGEKQLFKAWKQQNAELIEQAGEQHADMKLPAFTLAGLMFASVMATVRSSSSSRRSPTAMLRQRSSSASTSARRRSS
jgi:hypothetical protein